MRRDRITLTLASLAISFAGVMSCTSSEQIDQTGAAGAASSGTAGAGNTSGTAGAGNTGGPAGTSGAAGTTRRRRHERRRAARAAPRARAVPRARAGTGGTTAGAGRLDRHRGRGTDAGAGGSTGATISFATSIYPFIKTQCMPCHTKATGQDGGPLDMSSAMAAYKSLVGTATPPTGAPAKTDTGCKLLDTKKLRVEPTDPMHSYLYIKITNTDAQLSAQNCGPAMPKTIRNLTLTTAQIQSIHDWIMGGANP